MKRVQLERAAQIGKTKANFWLKEFEDRGMIARSPNGPHTYYMWAKTRQAECQTQVAARSARPPPHMQVSSRSFTVDR